MGVIRGSLVSLICVVLVVSLLLMNSSLIVSSSLKYDNVKSQVGPLVEQFSSGDVSNLLPKDFDTGEAQAQGFNLTEEFETAKDKLKEKCAGQESYYFESEQFNVTIPCSYANETVESFVQKSTDQLLEQSYYKDYDCGFLDCVDKTGTPLSLISKNAQDYWKTKFYYLLLASLVLALLLYFAVENKTNVPIILGALIVLTALPFSKLETILSNFLQDIFLVVSKIFLGEASTVFWIMFVLGLVLLIGGIVLKIVRRKKGLDKKDGKK